MSFGERVGGSGGGVGVMIRLWEERREGLNQAVMEGGKVRRWWRLQGWMRGAATLTHPDCCSGKLNRQTDR